MNSYDLVNRQLNDEMQEIAERIGSGRTSERDRNRLAQIMYPKLKFYIWNFFKDNTETEEVLHNTLLKIFRNLESYNEKFRFTTWIYTIAKNEALLHQHKIRTQVTVRLDALSKTPIIEDSFESEYDKERYMEALYAMTTVELFSLPECIEKDILIDKEVNLMKGNDIAVKYSMNLNTVKTKIRKARRMVRDKVLENNPQMKDQINDFF